MPLSDDITAVLTEVGTAYTIHKPDGTSIVGEYMDYTSHTEHTTPIIRGFFIDFTLPHPTQAVVGDVIEYGNAVQLMIMAMSAEMFEDLPIDYLGSGYKVNAFGTIQRYTQDDGWDADYKKVQGWADIYTDVRGVMMDQIFRSDVTLIGNESIESELDRIHLHLSEYYVIEQGDRFYDSLTDKYYKIEQTEEHRFPGIKLYFLTEENR